jgi:hypothetical protein
VHDASTALNWTEGSPLSGGSDVSQEEKMQMRRARTTDEFMSESDTLEMLTSEKESLTKVRGLLCKVKTSRPFRRFTI